MQIKETRLTLHANLLVIHQTGVLITGKPSIGKTELSLALLDRGHQLVADDVVDIHYQHHRLIGLSPIRSRGYLWMTHLGIIDVKQCLGPEAVRESIDIQLVIHLVPHKTPNITQDPRYPHYQKIEILDITLPQYMVPVECCKNLPLFVETLIRMHHLGSDNKSIGEIFETR